MADRTMALGVALGDSYGAHPGAWRMPEADPNAYVDVEVQVRAAQTAERGGLDYAFYPDRAFLHGDLRTAPPMFSMEPLMVLSAVAHSTRRIGLVASASTSLAEPYTLARQLRALDVISHGRAGWNAIPSYEPEAFANYGRKPLAREKKYERLHEVVQVTQALWGSWEREAGLPDQAAGTFADPAHVRPINMEGRHVGSRGPIQIPPSEQGQPVIFMPAASGMGLQAAGMYSNGIIAMPDTMEASRAQRDMIRSLAAASGRSPDEVKFLPFVTVSLGVSKREALKRRRALEERADLRSRLAHMSAILGLRLDPERADVPLAGSQISALRPHPGVPRAARAAELASEGWSPLDLLAHGVLDPNPGVVGTPEDAADMLQEWIEAGVCDGFTLAVDNLHDGLDDFVDQVVPELRKRGLRPADYQGTTLRDHLGLPEQLGVDPRLAAK
ncbi:NtaA/DmoA family FMN-dependent monooxygenase [Nocardioides sp. NPDC051685]|uniref:NtaA/DmoA family FMN-dependent monooxygenase n=1 Tax=Nocardioides sp. NPDC051685 TaxID=3364334 RepID=UPI0037AA3B3C